MPNTLIWRGDALGVAQVTLVTFSEIEGGDQFNLTINRKTISVVTSALPTTPQARLDNVVGLFIAAISSYSIPEWQEITASATVATGSAVILGLTLTGPSDGKPFTVAGTTGDAGNLEVSVVVTVEGDAGRNEKQRVTIPGTATGGTFTLTFDGQTTGAIAYNASAATVDAALEALSNIAAGDVTVTGNAGGPWTVEFLQAFANTDVPLLTGDGSSITKGATDYPVVVTTLTQGDPGRNEKQEIWLSGSPTGGTFTLTWQGDTTGAIAYNASAATVQTALEALAAITAGDVSVTAGTTGHWIVEFLATYRNTDVDLITGNGSSLTGGLSVAVTEITKGATASNGEHTFSAMSGTFNITFTNPLTSATATVTVNAAPNPPALSVFRDLLHSVSFLNSGNLIVTADSTTPAVYRILWIGEFGGRAITAPTISIPTGVTGAATVTTITGGGAAGQFEVQQVQLAGGPTGGTFTLTFEGVTTAAIAYNAAASAVKSAIDTALTTFTACTVTGNAGGPWLVTFGQRLTAEGPEDVALMTGSGASLTGGSVYSTTIQTATAARNEIQRVALFGNPAGGTFTLTYAAATTGALTFDESAADVESALDGLAGIDDCTVTGPAGGPWTVEFQGTQTGTDVSAITGDGTSLSGATILVEVTQTAAVTVNEVETITLLGSPTGGTFTLTYDSQETAAIDYDATAESVRLALEALSNIDVGEVDVTGSAGGPWTVTFLGGLGGQDIADVTGDATNLTATGTQSITVTASVSPTGPHHWDEADNWHNPAAPGTAVAPAAGDTVWFQNSDVDCLYGLTANTAQTLAALHAMASYTGNIGLNSVSDTDYWEYRPLNLACGFTNVYIGEGEGSGSERVRLDLEAVVSTVEVFRTGASPTNTPAFVYKGGAATTALRVFRGQAGVAKGLASDTANCQALTVGYITSQTSDAEVTIGTGCGTITTVNKSGGLLVVEDVSLTTVIHDGGEMTIDGAGAVTTLRVNEGEVYYRSSGTITTLLVGQGGTVDFSQSHLARTVTTLTVYSGSTVLDPFNTVTWTNPIILDRCSLPEVTLDVGVHRTLAVAAGA